MRSMILALAIALLGIQPVKGNSPADSLKGVGCFAVMIGELPDTVKAFGLSPKDLTSQLESRVRTVPSFNSCADLERRIQSELDHLKRTPGDRTQAQKERLERMIQAFADQARIYITVHAYTNATYPITLFAVHIDVFQQGTLSRNNKVTLSMITWQTADYNVLPSAKASVGIRDLAARLVDQLVDAYLSVNP